MGGGGGEEERRERGMHGSSFRILQHSYSQVIQFSRCSSEISTVNSLRPELPRLPSGDARK